MYEGDVWGLLSRDICVSPCVVPVLVFCSPCAGPISVLLYPGELSGACSTDEDSDTVCLSTIHLL